MQVIVTILSLLTMSMNSYCCRKEFDCKLLNNTIEAMDRLMAYLNRRYSYIIDLLYGVILARGQLYVLSKHLSMNSWHKELLPQAHLRKWITMCNNIYYGSSPIIDQSTTITILQSVIKPDVWELDKNITTGILREPSGHWKMGSIYWQLKSKSELRSSGEPSETQSDICLTELTKCKLSSKCWNIMTKNDKATGYAVTHRLLYFQVARQLNCLNNTLLSDVENRILNFCSNIYQETKNLNKLGPPVGLRDLFLEQIVLCSIEGFAEFLKPQWLMKMLAWQIPHGCFSEEQKTGSRIKRFDHPLDEDCTMHITGLSAAAISLFLRAILE